MIQSVIFDIQQKLNNKEITCLELVQDKINALKQANDNATNLILEQEAIEKAKLIDAKIARGEKLALLEGVPFGVKDVFLLQNTISTASSNILKNYLSPYSATAIQRLIDAGAIPVAKENCDAFGHGSTNENSVFGEVKNALDSSKVSGGSSGGSAVNVAKNNTVFSIGGDTGGSIRQPAGYNKVYGLKPTYGKVSRYGLMAYTSSSDCVGPIAQTVTDIAIVLNQMSGLDSKDQTSFQSDKINIDKLGEGVDFKQIKVGVYSTFINHPSLSLEIKDSFNKFIETLQNLGVTIQYLDFFQGETLTATYYIIALAETASNLSRIDGIAYGKRVENKATLKETYLATRGEGFSEETKKRIVAGNQVLSVGYSDEIYKKALKVRKSIEKKFSDDFEKVDFIISPIAPITPPKIGESLQDPLAMYASDIYTVGFSLGGLPTLSAPFNLLHNVQITAKKGADEQILKLAFALEQKK